MLHSMNVKNLILLAATLIPLASQADEVIMDANWKYRIVDKANNKVLLIGSVNPLRPSTLSLPSETNYAGKTYTVTGIGREAFANWTGLTSVWLPSSVEYIGEGAFKGCPLKEIHCQSEQPPTFSGKSRSNDVAIENMRLRDPFIFADTEQYKYYTYMPRWVNGLPGIEKYESYDLRRWHSTGWAWDHKEGFLGNCDNWAPDMYEYNGDYYIFVTFSRVFDTSNTDHWNLSNFEIKAGVAVLKSTDGPGGKFYPMFDAESGRLNHTPSNMMCIDGALYVDTDGQPWMIYSGELTQYYDGRVYAQKMKKDLSDMEGEPHFLFSGSQSGWSRNSGYHDGHASYITDAPFIFRDDATGKLILIWSSNSSTGYAVGQAISDSGKVTGPWRHLTPQLNVDNGGHGMLFRDFEGKLMLSYHTTEYGAKVEHMCAREVTLANGQLQTLDMVNGYNVKSEDVNPSFDDGTFATAKVYIPRNIYMNYFLGEQWNDFTNLTLETAGVEDVEAAEQEPNYEINGTTLTLLPGNAPSEVYGIDGALLCTFSADGGQYTFPRPGIYILKSATKAYKLKI